MADKSCENCGKFCINNQHCYGKCNDFSLWQPIPPKQDNVVEVERQKREHKKRYLKEWRTKNKDKEKVTARKWALKNPEKLRAKKKRQRLKYPEKGAERSRRWHLKNRSKALAAARSCLLRKNYGITPEEYQRILLSQNGVCAICGKKETTKGGVERSLCVDHDHVTGKNRELLCHRCNSGLGYFGDNTNLLLIAIEYLRKHSSSLKPPDYSPELIAWARSKGAKI